MKFEQLAHKSVRLGDLRVRLARVEDQDYLERMGTLAGAPRPGERVSDPLYQKGVRAALDQKGGYWRSIIGSYNAAGAAGWELGRALKDAVDTASFDLVALKDREKVGAVTVGASNHVIANLVDRLGNEGQHQVLSLIVGMPKIVSIGVEEQERGHGYGAALLSLTRRLLARMGTVGMFGECPDEERLVGFYQAAGFTVLAPGQALNVYPVAGRHVVTRRFGNRDEGPFIGAEKGYRIFYCVGEQKNDTAMMMARMNSAQ